MGSVTPLENDKFVIPILLLHIAISVTTSTCVIILVNSEEAVKVAKELNGQTFFGEVMSVKVDALFTKDVDFQFSTSRRK